MSPVKRWKCPQIAEGLAALGADGIVVTTLVNVRYLSGFTGSNGVLLVRADGEATLITDGRYRDQAADEAPDVELVIVRDAVATAADRIDGIWACETHTLSVDAHAALTAGGATLVPGNRMVEDLRAVKDDDEIAYLERACQISVDALEELLTMRFEGRTERELARDLEFRMFEHGAEAIAFETILASGPHAAIPHHRPTERAIERGDLVKIDFGARVDGYHADCTRTVVVGAPADWQVEIHAAVQASQAAGVAALRAGEPIADADKIARAILDDAGWLEYLTTGVGHGVGLEIHEDPYVGPRTAGKLAAGTTLTMEPGIYLPGRGGVRIEDTVLVGETPRVLTTMTTDLLEIA
ncbi:MAG TPA: Xaa-Pro peptidase family protein [Aeromicrobium sp.]|nr:Xaa-Pro peptidase family protein [Aeromicrobium sp.]